MVFDTSAIVAILLDEPERRALNEKIQADDTRLISAVTYVEASVVPEARRREVGRYDLERFVAVSAIEMRDVDREQAEAARAAYRRYGKGNDRAALNRDDCFACALAKTTGEPLLYNGGDFAHIDVATA